MMYQEHYKPIPGMPFMEKLSWQQISQEIKENNREFANIVDEIDPKDDLFFIRMIYPFGTNMVTRGLLNVMTNEGRLLSIADPKVPDFLQQQLSYSPVPIGLVTNNTVEVFRELEGRAFPVAAWITGFEVGIWEYSGWTTPYNVSAGARSLYMVPRITLTSGHRKLKREFGVTLPPPKKVSDHWHIFRQMVNSPHFSEPWYCEMIYLAKAWQTHLEKYRHVRKSPWYDLHQILIYKNLLHSMYSRQRAILEMVMWDFTIRSLNPKGIKPDPYVLDTLKHLIFLATGGTPASAPCTGSNHFGPIPAIQQAYLECYGLKYIPTIMQPTFLNATHTNPIYYSLQSPTLLEMVPKARNLSSIMDNIREVKELIDHFLQESFHDLKINNASLNETLAKTQFDFFHEQNYAYGKLVRPTHEMPQADPHLLHVPGDNAKQLKFADGSPYLHGCVRISFKKTQS